MLKIFREKLNTCTGTESLKEFKGHLDSLRFNSLSKHKILECLNTVPMKHNNYF
jgi:hypothetical protein